MAKPYDKRQCWACGVDVDDLRAGMIYGPPGLAMCFGCIVRYDPNADLAFSGACCFCRDKIGHTYRWLRRRHVRAAVVLGDSAMCNGCLQLMRHIVHQETSDEQAI